MIFIYYLYFTAPPHLHHHHSDDDTRETRLQSRWRLDGDVMWLRARGMAQPSGNKVLWEAVGIRVKYVMLSLPFLNSIYPALEKKNSITTVFRD